MYTYLLSYDLGGPEAAANYAHLRDYLQKYYSGIKPLRSFWILQTSQTQGQVLDGIKAFLDENDKIIILDVTHSTWNSRGFSPKMTEWIGQRIKLDLNSFLGRIRKLSVKPKPRSFLDSLKN